MAVLGLGVGLWGHDRVTDDGPVSEERDFADDRVGRDFADVDEAANEVPRRLAIAQSRRHHLDLLEAPDWHSGIDQATRGARRQRRVVGRPFLVHWASLKCAFSSSSRSLIRWATRWRSGPRASQVTALIASWATRTMRSR